MNKKVIGLVGFTLTMFLHISSALPLTILGILMKLNQGITYRKSLKPMELLLMT